MRVLGWIFFFLVATVISAIVGFSGESGVAKSIAQLLFCFSFYFFALLCVTVVATT
jgi:uncharacterized membrane protein YtjA (UPF0391 family)